ncbi:hypothetical protein QTN25_002289 [Entamoeba marina]
MKNEFNIVHKLKQLEAQKFQTSDMNVQPSSENDLVCYSFDPNQSQPDLKYFKSMFSSYGGVDSIKIIEHEYMGVIVFVKFVIPAMVDQLFEQNFMDPKADYRMNFFIHETK